MSQLLTSFIFILFATITINISPSCHIKQSIGTVPIIGDSHEHLFLLDIIDGYNLTFFINQQPDCIKITPAVSKINSSPISDQITTPNYILKIRQDWNGVWKREAALTYYENQKYYVNFGTKNSNQNFDFNSSKNQISFENQTNCFDTSYFDRFLALGCRQSNTQLIIALVDDNYQKVFTYQNISNVTNVKLLKYLSSDLRNYLLAVVSTNEEDFILVFNYNTYISDSTFNIEKVIDKKAFGLDLLKISDVAVDSYGNIYITNIDNIFKITYLKKNIVNLGNKKLHQVDKLITLKRKSEQFIFVEVNHQIIAYTEQLSQIKNFKLPLNESVAQMKANQNYLFVVTNFTRYIYSIETTQIVEAKKLQQKILFFDVQQASNLLLLVVEGRTCQLFTVGKGQISVSKPTQNLTVNLIASSNNQTDDLICSVSFDINIYDDPQKAIIIKSFQPTTYLQSPVKFTMKIDDYFVGPMLSYFGYPQDSDIYDYKQKETIQIPYPKFQQSKVLNPIQATTLVLDDNNYLRLVCQNKTIVIQKCFVSGTFVTVTPFYSLQTDSQISLCDINMVKIDNQLMLALGYVMVNQPNMVITIVLQTDKKHYFQINEPEQKLLISFLKLTQNFVVLMFSNKDLINLFSFEDNILFGINQDYFVKNQISQVKQFYPKNIYFSKQQDTFYIANTDSVLVFLLSKQDMAYLTSIKVPQSLLAGDLWSVVASNSHLLIVIPPPFNKIYKYKIQSKRDYLLLGSIYFQGLISQPIQLKSTENFAFILVNRARVITLRINSPFFSTYYNSAEQMINSDVWFTAIQAGNFTIIDIKKLKEQNSISSRYQNLPTFTIITNNNQNKLKQLYPVQINANALKSIVILKTNLFVYNYEISINSKESKYKKIYLLESISAQSQTIVNIDIKSFFTGSVINYTLECEFCENSIKLRVPFTLNKTNLTDKSLDHINIGNDSLWILKTQQIAYSSNDGQTFKRKIIKANGKKFIPIDNNQVFIFCPDSNPAPRFVSILAKQEGSPEESYGFTISQKYLINNIEKTKLVDNYLTIFGDNQIKIFKLTRNFDGTINSTVGETIITSTSFGLSQDSIINDFEIFSTENSTIKVIVCTIGNGLAYGHFNFESNASLLNSNFLNLNNNSKISDLVMNSNEYLQIKYLYSNAQQKEHTFILASSFGAHLQISLIFSTQYTINQINIINFFSKYGSQTVQKKAMFLPHSSQAQNIFIIPHLNQTTNLITLALYSYNNKVSSQITSIKGGIEMYNIDSMYFYRINDYLVRFISNAKSNLTGILDMKIFNVSQSLQLYLTYPQSGKFNSMQLIGSNIYSKLSIRIPVKFGNSLQWYTILIIVVASLIVVGLIAFGVFKYIKYKRSKNNNNESTIWSENKTSLMSEKNEQEP